MTEKLKIGQLYEWSAQLYTNYPRMRYGTYTTSLNLFNGEASHTRYIISDGERMLYLGQKLNLSGEPEDIYMFLINEEVMSIRTADIVKVIKPIA